MFTQGKYVTLLAASPVLLALSVLAPTTAFAQKPDTNVVVVNPSPIPVSGTVQAQQSGTWSVGLTGTPTVTLAGVPTFTLATPAAPLPVTVTLPAEAFTMPPTSLALSLSGSELLKPDPSGTRYAITSVVVSNPTSVQLELNVQAVGYSAVGSTCVGIANVTATAQGPRLTVQPNSTGILTFPVPFVTAPVTGSGVCLAAAGNNTIGTNFSMVGYKILPK